MAINPTIFKELVKRGYSKKNGTRVWDISDSKLWYLTPEMVKGFLKLAKYEPYRKNVVDRELRLIEKYTNGIIKKTGLKSFNLVNLGCGSGRKGAAFIKNLNKDIKIRYCPVDISKEFTEQATARVKGLNSPVVASIKPFVSDFKDFDEIVAMLRNGTYQSNVILLLGETLAHYDINEFLHNLSESMISGCYLIIGNGIQVGKRFTNIEKYKAPLFNQWFIHIMKGMGFNENEVEYDARFNTVRVEGYYKVKVDKEISYKGKKVKFKAGDEVIVGIQYKYFENELKKFCKMYFNEVEILKDEDGEYCLAVCKK